MRRTDKRCRPGVEGVESRVVPSTAAVLVSQPVLAGVVRDVRSIMGTLARTGHLERADVELTRLSARIPAGPEELAPSWQQDLALYRPDRAGSVRAAERRILADLYEYVQVGNIGTPPATGSGSTTAPTSGSGTGSSSAPGGGSGRPAPASSLDSVTIQNETGLALRVTVYLEVPQVQKPWITETLPAQGDTTALFNFGTATDAFMTADIARADGGQSPPPLDNLSLDQPMGGYDGTPFTVSILGSYFDVTPG